MVWIAIILYCLGSFICQEFLFDEKYAIKTPPPFALSFLYPWSWNWVQGEEESILVSFRKIICDLSSLFSMLYIWILSTPAL